MARKNLNLTETEWFIIRTVWGNEPCTAPLVQEKLHNKKKWSYSTVKTIMDRMAKKGLLKTQKLRNLTLYNSVITRRQAQQSEITQIVKRAFNGAITPMMQFLLENNSLSENEMKEIGKMIKKQKKTKPKKNIKK